MEGINSELIYLSQINVKIDDDILNKLKTSVKYYFSRASSSVRNSEIIQLNHFIDDLRLSEGSDSASAVFSPSKVALPLAAQLNLALLRGSSSQIFLIDKNGNINIHPLDIVIPVMIAIFSGNSIITVFSNCTSMFMACLFLSVEILDSLLSRGVSTYNSALITISLISSSLMSIKKKSVMYIIDKLFNCDQQFSIREWLELIYSHRYPPYRHVDSHIPSKHVQDLLITFESPFLVRNSPIKFSGNKSLYFCLPLFSPLTSVVCASIPSEVLETSFKTMTFSIHSNLSNDTRIISSHLPTTSNNAQCHLKWCLSSFLVWVYERQQPLSCILFDLNNASTKAIFDKIIIDIVDSDNFLIKIDVTYNNESLNRYFLNQSDLTMSFDKWNVMLNESIVTELSCTVGVDGSRMLLANIDHPSHEQSVQEALTFVYERPPLD